MPMCKCTRCQILFFFNGMPSSSEQVVCEKCEKLYPPALIKATYDSPFEYVLKTRAGDLIFFEGAELLPGGKWVRVWFGEDPIDDSTPMLFGSPRSDGTPQLEPPCPRGIEVRVADIVWCADAPFGS